MVTYKQPDIQGKLEEGNNVQNSPSLIKTPENVGKKEARDLQTSKAIMASIIGIMNSAHRIIRGEKS